MTQLEKLALIDMAIKTVQGFITATPDEDHYGDIEYLDSLRTLYLSTLGDNDTQNNKQTMKDLYEVLTEAHDQAMEDTLDNIFSNNYVIPSHFTVEEIVEHLESMEDATDTIH